MEKLTEQEKIRRQKMEELKEMGIEPFGQAYERTHKSGQIRAEYEGCTKEELEEKNVTVRPDKRSASGNVAYPFVNGSLPLNTGTERGGVFTLAIGTTL